MDKRERTEALQKLSEEERRVRADLEKAKQQAGAWLDGCVMSATAVATQGVQARKKAFDAALKDAVVIRDNAIRAANRLHDERVSVMQRDRRAADDEAETKLETVKKQYQAEHDKRVLEAEAQFADAFRDIVKKRKELEPKPVAKPAPATPASPPTSTPTPTPGAPA